MKNFVFHEDCQNGFYGKVKHLILQISFVGHLSSALVCFEQLLGSYLPPKNFECISKFWQKNQKFLKENSMDFLLFFRGKFFILRRTPKLSLDQSEASYIGHKLCKASFRFSGLLRTAFGSYLLPQNFESISKISQKNQKFLKKTVRIHCCFLEKKRLFTWSTKMSIMAKWGIKTCTKASEDFFRVLGPCWNNFWDTYSDKKILGTF